MQIEIDYTKSAQDNAESYFERAKDAKRRKEGAELNIKKLEERVKNLEKESVVEKQLTKKEERDWYEKFNWFFTSNGLLVIGGRSAQQNEEVVSKHFDADDLFFHANVFGASVVILKTGVNADRQVKEEVAQFAASMSKAWEDGLAAVDVFSAKRDQVSKQTKGSLGTGSFYITGEREWYRNVKLELGAVFGKKLSIVPYTAYPKLIQEKGVRLIPGKLKKSDTAKAIAKKLGYPDIDYIMQHLPAGEFSLE